jgi:hypothetical protein
LVARFSSAFTSARLAVDLGTGAALASHSVEAPLASAFTSARDFSDLGTGAVVAS